MGTPSRSAGTIRVEGADQLRRTLKKAGDDLGDLKEGHREAAGIAGRRAQADAPRVTGRLARSTRWGASNRAAIVRAGGARVPYANPIHWGWPRRNIKPQPWVSEAAEATEPEWSAAYAQAVDRILSRIKGI